MFEQNIFNQAFKDEIDKQAEREGIAIKQLKILSPKNKNNNSIPKTVAYQKLSKNSDKARVAFDRLFRE